MKPEVTVSRPADTVAIRAALRVFKDQMAMPVMTGRLAAAKVLDSMEAIELYDMVAEDPRLREVLERFVEGERKGRPKDYFLGLEWFEVQANAKTSIVS